MPDERGTIKKRDATGAMTSASPPGRWLVACGKLRRTSRRLIWCAALAGPESARMVGSAQVGGCVECGGLLLNGSVASDGTLVLRFPTPGMLILNSALRTPLFCAIGHAAACRENQAGVKCFGARSQVASPRRGRLSVAAKIDGLMRDQYSGHDPTRPGQFCTVSDGLAGSSGPVPLAGTTWRQYRSGKAFTVWGPANRERFIVAARPEAG
ncbi:hypothetical protein MCOR02_011639 [Pyricularia oryzae]|uniref:Uncharacterized protein n=4 Tax=Pyricularia oryzae TaxID=318829 RepID=G4N148_PYRO7|nr:uncharacterized protein MGG_16635 [Pyricularia oryzae 70-15]ELQ38148.1 hypothetical protein OOU_Y34scaffold00552g103 [Pyricularia oryzae Y34]KAH9428151.1 hypothetical protein MCOR02_011639 [Pyricularia oryzae]EHA51527.1 hypothetical protein MGG_16635 [Pyricularia oryzae 70-15]KAI6263503.1 hypothetical protein MCOR19_000401 [Pyricularia oryzae]KAI6336070.1 hypothetical protein MCOR29_000231 [Pyricularia oryzae]